MKVYKIVMEIEFEDENIAFARAIEEGEHTPVVDREQIFELFESAKTQ